MPRSYKFKDVTDYPIDKLKVNPDNNKYFKQETTEYFDDLYESIKQNGILVPLIAKSDGKILCGHNRYLVAKTLKIKAVPVRVLSQRITAEQELQIIKDENSKRRHLTRGQRFELYRDSIREFDKVILMENRGCSKHFANDMNPGIIANKTGIPKEIVQRDIKEERRKRERETYDKLKMPNMVVVKSAETKINSIIGMCEFESDITRNQIIEKVERVLQRLKKSIAS